MPDCARNCACPARAASAAPISSPSSAFHARNSGGRFPAGMALFIRWMMAVYGALGGLFGVFAPSFSARRSSGTPVPSRALIGSTRMPSRADNFSVSMVMPRFRHSSIMFSAIVIGRDSCVS